MRRPTARTRAARVVYAAAAACLALGLSACGGSAEPAATSTTTAGGTADSAAGLAADQAALEGVTLSEAAAGEEPTITLPGTPFVVTNLVARLVRDGDGAALEDGQQMSVHMSLMSGADGSATGSTYSGPAEVLTVGNTSIPVLDEALAGAHVGARLLLALPADTATQVYALEVVEAFSVPARAEGEAVAPVEGLPTVTLADNGAPAITPAAGAAPTGLVVQPLIQGTGAVTETGQQLTVKYTGWLWDGTQFDSSWDDDTTFSVTLGAGQVIDGWDQGLVGLTVGSQVLLVIPPDLGYGDQDNGTIPAGSTLVFVVDVLDAR